MKQSIRIAQKYYADWESRCGDAFSDDVAAVKQSKMYAWLEVTPAGLKELLSDSNYVRTEHKEYDRGLAASADRAYYQLLNAAARQSADGTVSVEMTGSKLSAYPKSETVVVQHTWMFSEERNVHYIPKEEIGAKVLVWEIDDGFYRVHASLEPMIAAGDRLLGSLEDAKERALFCLRWLQERF